jgi:hypothetical protein
VKKLLALATALTVVLLLSVGPAAAQTYPIAVDRNSVTLTYWPIGVGALAGTSGTAAGLSYQFNPQWDALVGYRSGPAAGTTLFTFGGRYHLRPPAPGWDTFATVQYASPSGGAASYLMVGGGAVQSVAPGVKAYEIVNYAFIPAGANIFANLGLQFELQRNWSFVTGLDVSTGTGYLGVTFDFSTR